MSGYFSEHPPFVESFFGEYVNLFGAFLKVIPSFVHTQTPAAILNSPLEFHDWLVVWNMFLFFHSVGNFIIPTDEIHDFSEG